MPVPTIGNISLPETKKSHPAGRSRQPLKGGMCGAEAIMTLGDLASHEFQTETTSPNDVVSAIRNLVHDQPLIIVAVSAAFGFIAAILFARR